LADRLNLRSEPGFHFRRAWRRTQPALKRQTSCEGLPAKGAAITGEGWRNGAHIHIRSAMSRANHHLTSGRKGRQVFHNAHVRTFNHDIGLCARRSQMRKYVFNRREQTGQRGLPSSWQWHPPAFSRRDFRLFENLSRIRRAEKSIAPLFRKIERERFSRCWPGRLLFIWMSSGSECSSLAPWFIRQLTWDLTGQSSTVEWILCRMFSCQCHTYFLVLRLLVHHAMILA